MQRGLAHRPLRSDRSPAEVIAAVITELMLLAVAGLGGFVVLGLLMGTGLLPDPAEHLWAGVIGGPLMMAASVLTYWGIEKLMDRQGQRSEPLVAPSEQMPWPTTLGVVLLHVGAAVAGSVVLGAIQELLFKQPVTEQDAIVDMVATGDPVLLGLLAVVAVGLAPLTEEALFRGLFFRRLMTRGSVSAAWVLPAVVFAAAHWNPIGLAIYVWLGLVFAHAYSRTGRLTAAILTHAGANAITLSLLFFAPPPEVEAAQADQGEHADDASEQP